MKKNEITFCFVIVTLSEKKVNFHINNFTYQPYNSKKGLHIANFQVMTQEQTKHCKIVDPVSKWHRLNVKENYATYYISRLLKANRNSHQYKQFWYPTPENPTNEVSETPRQKRIHQLLRALQDVKKLNPQDVAETPPVHITLLIPANKFPDLAICINNQSQ